MSGLLLSGCLVGQFLQNGYQSRCRIFSISTQTTLDCFENCHAVKNCGSVSSSLSFTMLTIVNFRHTSMLHILRIH